MKAKDALEGATRFLALAEELSRPIDADDIAELMPPMRAVASPSPTRMFRSERWPALDLAIANMANATW